MRQEWEYVISWRRPGGASRIREIRQTLKGAVDLLARRLGERGEECLRQSHGHLGGYTCWDRLTETELAKAHERRDAGERSDIGVEMCVVCAERYACDMAIDCRKVGEWAALDPRALDLPGWASCYIDEAMRASEGRPC